MTPRRPRTASYEPRTALPPLAIQARNPAWEFRRGDYQNTWWKVRVAGDAPWRLIGAEENLPAYVKKQLHK